MNFFHHKDLGNHLLQLCPKVVKHPVYYKLKLGLYQLHQQWINKRNVRVLFFISTQNKNALKAACLAMCHDITFQQQTRLMQVICESICKAECIYQLFHTVFINDTSTANVYFI